MQNFSHRLNLKLRNVINLKDGKNEKVNIKRFAKNIGCSYQTAKKYIFGQVLPNHNNLLKIAK